MSNNIYQMIGEENIKNGKYWSKSLTLVSGCTPCSPGCAHCWALAMEKRFRPQEGIKIHPERLDIPLKRKKPTVWAIWNDLGHEEVPESFFHEVMEYINVCPEHVFLLLTKRPKKLKEQLDHLSLLPFNQTTVDSFECYWRDRLPLKNLWLGVTVCNQKEADEKIPILLQIPAEIRWISIEPILGPIIFPKITVGKKHLPGGKSEPITVSSLGSKTLCGEDLYDFEGISWVVLGGESGPGARSMNPEWAVSVKDQCVSAGVSFFFKSHGSYYKLGKSTSRLLDGRTWNELPEVKG